MWYKAETNGSKMIKFGAYYLKMGAMCRLYTETKAKENKENILIDIMDI